MDIRILVADDDQIFRELVCDIVEKEGYFPVEACDGKQALDIFFSNNFDMLILDVMMPVYDGWEVLKEVREHSDVPVIMLTALGDEKHEVLGLKSGASDYIAKPFSYEVFVARLNAHLRKFKKELHKEIKAGGIKISLASRKVWVNEKEIDLNRKEYGLLVYFIDNKNIVLTRELILSRIWGYSFEGDARTIDTHIKTLRTKLSVCGDYIKTVRGIGYMFEVNAL